VSSPAALRAAERCAEYAALWADAKAQCELLRTDRAELIEALREVMGFVETTPSGRSAFRKAHAALAKHGKE
jgi:hypothetical protein